MAGLEMRYFVLSPASGDEAHAKASRAAIRAYAASMTFSNAQLASDLIDWVRNIESPTGNVEFEKAFDTLNAMNATMEAVTGIPAAHMDNGEKRDTFEIPDGWAAMRDIEGRATGNLIRSSDGHICHYTSMERWKAATDHEGADIRQDHPRNLLEEPPEGWFVEKDARTQNPNGYLVRTEDGTRKWHTDPMFKQQG